MVNAVKSDFALKVALLLFISYLALGLLQAPSYLKIDPAASIYDPVASAVLFALILFPAAYWGVRINPEYLPILGHLLHRGKARLELFLRPILLALGLGALAFLVNLALSALFTWAGAPPTTQSYVLKFSLFDKVVSSASSGLWEETIFRLFLISVGVVVMRSRISSAILANLLFTFMHVVLQSPPYNPSALTIVFVIGLIYTKCFLDHGFEAAATCHGTMNFLVMILGPLLQIP